MSNQNQGKPRVSAPGPLGQGPLDPVSPTRNIQAFWELLPWSEVDYFSRDFYENPNVMAAGASNTIDQFTIPKGQALIFTSILFRAFIETDPGPPIARYSFAPDDYYYTFNGVGIFRFLIGGKSPMDRVYAGGVGVFNANVNAWVTLNQNIAIPGHPFYLVARENQVVETKGNATAAVLALPVSLVGVEYRGIWVPIAVYDKLRARFTAKEA